MFGINNLKSKFEITESHVHCPVVGCDEKVTRRRNGDGALKSKSFYCKNCKIFISASTFEYENEAENLLWQEPADTNLLSDIKASKAEIDRLSRERSEDAVSWNLFRYFDRTNRTGELVCKLGDIQSETAETIYWSFYPKQKSPWDLLIDARVEFGEAPTHAQAKIGKRVSEPDIILLADKHVVFVEAKFGSTNRTSGSQESIKKRIANPKKYQTCGNFWYNRVFESKYCEVIEDQKYELMRFWLLGSWIANKSERSFVLANLVRQPCETEIACSFGKHIKQSKERRFVRWTWESFEPLLNVANDQEAKLLRDYLAYKTIGFTENKNRKTAKPKKAFAIL